LVSQNGGLINTAATNDPLTNNFNRRINYTAYIQGWGETGEGTGKANLNTYVVGDDLTSKTPISRSGVRDDNVKATNAKSASLRIATTEDKTGRLLAGDYEDVLTIKLGTGF